MGNCSFGCIIFPGSLASTLSPQLSRIWLTWLVSTYVNVCVPLEFKGSSCKGIVARADSRNLTLLVMNMFILFCVFSEFSTSQTITPLTIFKVCTLYLCFTWMVHVTSLICIYIIFKKINTKERGWHPTINFQLMFYSGRFDSNRIRM